MLAATAALGAGTAPALAGTLHVSTTADVSSGAGDVGACASGGGCSLRQALALAAFETSDIVLPAGTYELTQGPLVAQRAPGFSTLTQLRGAGAATTTITQTTPGGGRLLDILSGQSEISGITFTGGSVHGADGDASDPDGAVAAGGAIRIAGYPQFFDVVITGNEVVGGDGAPGGDGGAARGGAIEVVDGTPHFERSTVTGNSARGGDGGDGAAPGDGGDAFGGAVDNVATVKLEESTIAGNSARGGGAGAPAAAAEGDAGDAYGGAIAHRGWTLDIWGTTVSGNVAQGAEAVGSGLSGAASGGGVYAEPTFLILRATIADKVARAGAAGAGASRGVASGGGIAGNEDGRSGDNRDQLVMSTVARNVAETTDADGDPAGVGGNIHRPAAAVVPMTAIGALVAEGEAAPGSENCSFHPLSLGGDVEDDAAGQCGFATRGDARLGLLGDHGGPTATIPLLSGSAAIDAGSCDPNWYTRATLDQRGVPRPYETGCDAGAFESNPPVYPPPVDGGGSGDRGNGGGDVAQPERPIGRAPHGADAKPRAVASARRPLVRFSLRRPAIVALRIVALSKGRAHTLGTVRLGRRAAGRHVVTLPARAGGRALVAGRYRVTVVATNGDRSGRVVTTTALRVR